MVSSGGFPFGLSPSSGSNPNPNQSKPPIAGRMVPRRSLQEFFTEKWHYTIIDAPGVLAHLDVPDKSQNGSDGELASGKPSSP